MGNKLQNQKHYLKNKERISNHRKEFYKNNINKYKEYYQKNKDKILEKLKEKRDNNTILHHIYMLSE